MNTLAALTAERDALRHALVQADIDLANGNYSSAHVTISLALAGSTPAEPMTADISLGSFIGTAQIPGVRRVWRDQATSELDAELDWNEAGS